MAVRKPWKVNKDLLIYKSFYFFYWGALGAINPYLPVYLRQIGLSAFAVGLLVGIRPIIQLASAPFWTVVADKFRKRKSILVMSIMAWLVMTIALVFVEPTEEICEFSATNRSHSVFVNYTKLKTGFFKRSSATIHRVETPERTTQNVFGNNDGKREIILRRKVRSFVRRLPNVNSKDSKLTAFLLFANSFPNSSSGSQNSRQTTKQVQTSVRGDHKLQTNQIHKSNMSLSQRHPPDQRDRENQILSKITETHNDLHQHQSDHLMSKPTKIRINPLHQLTTHKPSSSTTEPAIGTVANNFVTYAVDSNNTESPGQESSKTYQDNFPEAFDPFNMNGKGREISSGKLATFFAKSRNIATDKTAEDIRYYNMNGVDSQQRKPNIFQSNLTELSLDFSSKNISSLSLQKLTTSHPVNIGSTKIKEADSDLAQSLINGKDLNETLKFTKKNLFKTNVNEMKRLFVILLVLIVVGEFLETPSAPLSDASLLEYLGEGRIHYGKQRLWGSLAHGISSFLVGTLLERSRHLTCGEEFIDYTTCFCAFTVMMLTTLVITANFKFKYKDVEETNHNVFSTVLTVHYISFLSAACYMGICNGVLHNFLMWFLEDLGGSKTLMGLAIGSRSSADLITFFVASQLIETLGQIKIVFIALISYGTIFIAYSAMTNPWFALAVEFLGGLTYAASWSACTSYLAEAAPQESVTTMQGILQGVYWGLGTGTGAIMGGHLIHNLGANLTFRLAATGSFIVALIFAATQWKWQKEDLDESIGIYNYFSGAEREDTEALLKDKLEENTKLSDDRNVREKRKKRRGKSDKKQSTH